MATNSYASGRYTTDNNPFEYDGLTYIPYTGELNPTGPSTLAEYDSGSSSSGSSSDTSSAAATTKAITDKAEATATAAKSEIEKLNHVDTEEQKKQLAAQTENTKQQAEKQIDYSVQTGVDELERAKEDAASEYQTMRDQTDRDEAIALDNQALYAAAQGENGGIGKSQYDSVQNAANQSRLSINSAETKLATDTARQIADLRAQGEFEKADKLLEIENEYLEALQDLEKWATEQNISVDKFNAQLQEWENEYNLDLAELLTDTELSAAKATGAFSTGTPTYESANDEQDRLVNAGKAMISAGYVPTAAQLAAMGWTQGDYWNFLMTQDQ